MEIVSVKDMFSIGTVQQCKATKKELAPFVTVWYVISYGRLVARSYRYGMH